MELIEVRHGEFCIEASDIGFGPGLWPVSFRRDGILWSYMVTQLDREGDVVLVKYNDVNGNILTIWND